jgi:hypothetical protein
MLDLEGMTSEELLVQQKVYSRQAQHFRDLAQRCFNIRVSRDAAMMLREAELAKARAKHCVKCGLLRSTCDNPTGMCSDCRELALMG